ncbi:MAG: thioredoxin family protein [Candidatus Hodarchaeota archaeon]
MDTLKKLKEIDKSVHIQVFTLTTCPYCPKAVHMAHKFAMVNKNITADMIEA